MSVAILLLSLAASDQILVLDVNDETDAFQDAVISQVLVDEIARRGHRALSARDLQNLVELEGERQLLECDNESCLPELAGAIGARYVVFTGIGRLGAQWVANLVLFDADLARPVSRVTVEATNVDELGAQLRGAARELVRPLGGPSSPIFWTGVGLAAVGASTLAVGSVGLVSAELTFTDERVDASTRTAARESSIIWLTVAAVGAVVLAAGATVGVIGALE